MLNLRVIQESRSEWDSQVVIMLKWDGSHHFCVDYLSLNQVSKFDAYSTPWIKDVVGQLGPRGIFQQSN